MVTEGLEHARKLLTTEQFTSWLSRDESNLLVVDGHCKSFAHGKTSPLSVFCASLASTLRRSGSLVILWYFCGSHTVDSGDLPGGPLGLIRSLLGQLLYHPDDVLPENLRVASNLYNRADHENIDHLCEIFGAVFSQINPMKITICLLDNIAEYEGAYRGWAAGMCLIAD